ncbi:MAG: hypothetical protein HOI07_03560 [Betaproteobacteria bacterium]|jgi:uncharacterized membrane protein required for colicin V production|nr:hypothetical protein [Betaproteobacteria bacterium]
MSADATEALIAISRELEAQSLNAVVAGFSFAAALSWMDLVRWSIHQVIKVQKNGGLNYALTALFTTLLSVVVYMVVSRLSSRVKKPSPVVYAVSR